MIKLNNFFCWFAGIFLAFLHFGVDEYLSPQFFLALLFFSLSLRLLAADVNYLYVAISLFSVYLFISIAAKLNMHEFFVSFRCALCIFVIYSTKVLANNNFFDRNSIWSCIRIAVSLNFIVAFMQAIDSYTVKTGFFDVPSSFFALEYGTLFSEKRDQLAGTDFFFRPSGLMSEPSGLAAMGLVMFMFAIKNKNFYDKFISSGAIILSHSMSGICLLLLLIFLSGENKKNRISYIFAGLLFFSLIWFSGIFDDRVGRVSSGEDLSSRVRFLEPFRVLLESWWMGGFIGASRDILDGLMSSEVSTIYDNWIINQFLFYGVFGFFVVFCFISIFDKKIKFFIIMFSMMNGDVLYYDRVVLLSLIVIMSSPMIDGYNYKFPVSSPRKSGQLH